jgi:hypothetical protein
MAANFYYAKTHDEIVAGSAIFAAKLAAEFAELGLTSEQSAQFGAVNEALQSAWSVSSVPGTRTSVAVSATREAMKNMRAVAVPLAKVIVGNPAVDNAQLIALGLLPRAGRTPTAAIDAAPKLTILSTIGRQITVRVRDASGKRRGRVENAWGCVLYTFVGETPPTGVQGWRCEPPVMRGTAVVHFPASCAAGTKVWFAAQWFNSKGVGPGCTPVAAVIGVEGSLAA